ncbi:MAG: ribonuclease HII [Actinobacteria bacterium]|nr:ribonuclease HII [Actinomycetota bacterium]
MAGTATADTSALFEFDLESCGGDGDVAGADEVGRGCLAGPIVAAAVVFDYTLMKPEVISPLLSGLSDSKKLTPKVREQLFPLIIRHASRFTIISYSSRTIDRDGLQKTNLRVLARSLEALEHWPAVALVDGHLSLPECTVPHRPVKKGDSKSACIAAASILAKVTRDRLMMKLHERYPEYGFDGHVGYGSLSHREAIVQFGYSPLHRRSFNVSLPGTV